VTWWVVTRRYTVEEGVYVEADSASEAKTKARDGDYDDTTVAETVSPTTYRKADSLPAKPQHLWTDADWDAHDAA
jgi:hypothetical protein